MALSGFAMLAALFSSSAAADTITTCTSINQASKRNKTSEALAYEDCAQFAIKTIEGIKLKFFIGPLFRQAACEEGLPYIEWPKRTLYKYPRSWIDAVCRMDHHKVHQFSFVGSVFKNGASVNKRKWIFEFAKKYFGPGDYFKVTGPVKLSELKVGEGPSFTHFRSNFLFSKDAQHFFPNNGTYKTIGEFDHSLDGSSRVYPMAHLGSVWLPPFDEDYWRIMVRSRFTLCPAGDNPFSFRFFEAMIAGSIPIVLDARHTHFFGYNTSFIGFDYYLYKAKAENRYVYREDWVASNFAKVILHLTFLMNRSRHR